MSQFSGSPSERAMESAAEQTPAHLRGVEAALDRLAAVDAVAPRDLEDSIVEASHPALAPGRRAPAPLGGAWLFRRQALRIAAAVAVVGAVGMLAVLVARPGRRGGAVVTAAMVNEEIDAWLVETAGEGDLPLAELAALNSEIASLDGAAENPLPSIDDLLREDSM